MFKKSAKFIQQNLFTSGISIFSGKSLALYEDPKSWHNQFRKQVTLQIDESLFKPLYSSDQGTPNASIRVMISMMIIKEAEGLSDQKLFENCRFNMLVRSAVGLLNADDIVPTESTYYLFRKNVNDYAKAGNPNLFDTVFADITKNQCLEFNVSGKRIRMDSKLLGSNIAGSSRYELIHETLRLFYNNIKRHGKLDSGTEERLEDILKFKGNKVVYTSTSDEIKTKIQELGELIYKVLSIFSNSKGVQYKTLQRVFDEQYRVEADKIVITRRKEEISAKSVQSPHDTDCHFRNKDGNKVKGYSINVTESCDDDNGINLIGNVDVREVSVSDVEFFQDDVRNVEEVFLDKTENAHADGAYHSPENQSFCRENNIDLHLHAIQGAKGRYELNPLEDGELSVLDTKTDELTEAAKITNKTNVDKWRIKTKKGYRYFTQREIDTSGLRKQIEETPIEVLQKRNNIEAAIFQLAYHYPNAKSRYRGLIKHQMWADMRCLWVNFVRILKFIENTREKLAFFTKYVCNSIFKNLFHIYKLFFTKKWMENVSYYENIKFAVH